MCECCCGGDQTSTGSVCDRRAGSQKHQSDRPQKSSNLIVEKRWKSVDERRLRGCPVLLNSLNSAGYLSFQTSACVVFFSYVLSDQEPLCSSDDTGADFVMFTGILLFKVMQIKKQYYQWVEVLIGFLKTCREMCSKIRKIRTFLKVMKLEFI